MRHLLAILLLLVGCSPSSLEDFQQEGRARSLSLVLDLQKIQNDEQLQQALPALKRHFESLVDLMIQARQFQASHPDDTVPDSLSLQQAPLKEELRRLYKLERGRELIEKAQQEALVRLHAFEHSIHKKKEKHP